MQKNLLRTLKLPFLLVASCVLFGGLYPANGMQEGEIALKALTISRCSKTNPEPDHRWAQIPNRTEQRSRTTGCFGGNVEWYTATLEWTEASIAAEKRTHPSARVVDGEILSGSRTEWVHTDYNEPSPYSNIPNRRTHSTTVQVPTFFRDHNKLFFCQKCDEIIRELEQAAAKK